MINLMINLLLSINRLYNCNYIELVYIEPYFRFKDTISRNNKQSIIISDYNLIYYTNVLNFLRLESVGICIWNNIENDFVLYNNGIIKKYDIEIDKTRYILCTSRSLQMQEQICQANNIKIEPEV